MSRIVDKNEQSRRRYQQLAKQAEPKSDLARDILKAFLVGGLICAVGQAFLQLGRDVFMLNEDMNAAWVSIIMVFLGAVLTGLGVYDKIGSFAGAGSVVPITGFANAMVSPAIEFKTEGFILGTASKMFILTGPVLVYGYCTSILVGLIKFAVQAIFGG